MEQKRTLWIALATGFFLLAVVLGVMIFYQPLTTKQPTQQWIAPAERIETVTPSTYSQGYAQPQRTPQKLNPESENDATNETLSGTGSVVDIAIGSDAPNANPINISDNTSLQDANGPVTLNAENVNVYSDGTTNIYSSGTTIDLNASKNQQPSSVTAKNETAQNAVNEKNAKTEATVAQEQTKSNTTEKSVATVTPVKPNATSSSANTKKSSSASTSSTKSAASSKSSSKNASSSKSSGSSKTATNSVKPADSYWVQVAAYTTKKNADEAREILDQAKLPAEVFTHTDSKGTLYYRVRVGPYTTTSEADYWLSKITAIQNFKTAKPYITNTSAPASK